MLDIIDWIFVSMLYPQKKNLYIEILPTKVMVLESVTLGNN